VRGFSRQGIGVNGEGAGSGVTGVSEAGVGVFGRHLSRDGDTAGVWGWTESSANNAAGVLRRVNSMTAGFGSAGVRGETASTADSAVGVLGKVTATTAGFNSAGVEGDSASTADAAVGVLGQVTSITPASLSAGVRGINNGNGSAGGYGVYGSQYGSGRGVFGNSPRGFGVYGFSAGGVGVYGSGGAAAAGFEGAVIIDGDLTVTAGHVKAFRLDDPLDPKHKYLVHAAVESNQVLNTYSGNITTDERGVATVRLPAYFDRVNTDLRYQLTVIGQFAEAIIAEKEASNRFVIRTDKPNVEVSWQVTARRNDTYLRAHPFHDIRNKTKADQALTAKLHETPPSQPASP
jgi:hypothetical protein